MTQESDAVVTEARLDAPPQTVWRALTQPAIVAEWLGANDLGAEIGDRFTLAPEGSDKPVACEVLAAEPPHRLAYTWREAGAAVDSVVTFELAPAERGGTLLRIVHSAQTLAAPRRPATMIAARATGRRLAPQIRTVWRLAA